MTDKLLKEYNVSSEGVELGVKVIYREGEFVRSYVLEIPEYGTGTKALLDSLKHEIIMDESIKAEKLLDPKFLDALKQVFREKAGRILGKELPDVDEATKTELIAILINEMLGLGKIELLLTDGNLEEIVVNNAEEPVWVYHKEFGWLKTNVTMDSEEQIQNYANIIARRGGKQITILNPLLDTHLVTGDRANATLFPISGKGNTITIRRFRRDPWTVTDLIKNKTTTSEVMALIWMCMQYELNMILSGGTASGKCVSGETKIITPEGSMAIKEIVEEEMRKNATIRTEDGFFTARADTQVLSFNPENVTVEKSRVSKVWKRKVPEKMVRITTQSGKSIEVTPEHPFFVPGKLLQKKCAGEIMKGDFIPSARKLEIGEREVRELLCPDIKHARVMHNEGIWAKSRPNSKKWVRIPQRMTCELARFIGYVLGDGHITKDRRATRFFNKDRRLLDDFKACGERLFRITGKIVHPKNRCAYTEFYSVVLSEFLVQNFRIKPGKKSHSITMPQEILFGKKEYLKEIIRGLFECEASVDIKRGQLEFSSASPLVVEDLSTALHRFGILHITKRGNGRNRLFIGGKNLQEFGKEIGFLRPDKNDAILRSAKKTFSQNFDFVPNTGPALASLKKSLGMHEKEMRGTLSREAVSRYLTGKRNPTRESLLIVVRELEKRFDELQASKQRMREILESGEHNKKTLALAKEVYRMVNLTRNGLAEKSGVDKGTLWLWESGRTEPRAELLRKVGMAVSKEFDEYYGMLQAPVTDLYHAGKLGMTPTWASRETGFSLHTTSKYFRENAKIEELLSRAHQWQKRKTEELDSIKEKVSELKRILENPPAFDNYMELKAVKKKLGMRMATPVTGSTALIMRRLEEATSEETRSSIMWLKNMATGNVLWDMVTKVEKTEPHEQWVYDLTVEPNHTFFANNLVAHNTSFLNVCLPFIQPNHRVITLEDTRELLLPEFLHWIPMTTREPNAEGRGGVTMLDLLVNSLRQRPDRIIVGETRRQREAEVMFEAMHTGHSVYTTFHANTAEETIRRFTNPPIDIPPTMLDSVHLNVVMFRNRRVGVRRVLQVAEFIPEKRGNEETLKANTLYRWRAMDDSIGKDTDSIRLFDELSMHTGLTYDEINKDLASKKRVLEWLVKNDLHNINQVGKVMAKYYLDSAEVLRAVERGGKPEWV